MLERIRLYFQAEPARLISAVVLVIAALASVAQVTLDLPKVAEVVAVVLAIALGGQATRARVSPWAGEAKVNSDDLLPEALR